MADAVQPETTPAAEDAEQYRQTVDSYFDRLAVAATAPEGGVIDGPAATAGRTAFRRLRHLGATHYEVAVDSADYVTELNAEDRERFRIALSGLLQDLLESIDTAQAGRTVTALSVGTNAIRDDIPLYRTTFDDLIARYLTTGRYHESHEAFVTTALLLEQWLYALADSTTTAHDVLDDAVSSNTRILAALGRGLAHYGEQIAALPESSYRNVGRVVREQAEPQQLGRIVTALLTMHNRVAAADPAAQPQAYGRFLAAVDPDVVRTAVANATTAVAIGLKSNPELAKVVLRAIGETVWAAVKSVPKLWASR
ncbi:hypothetical protein ACWELJ_30185 [Nocardia sp. NPDC004582]